MAKDKALNVDGISDTIFKRETWRKIWREENNIRAQGQGERNREERKNKRNHRCARHCY